MLSKEQFDLKQKRILITGASGFIGGFLVDEALRRGYEVLAGVRRSSSRRQLQDARIRFIDLRYDDPKALTEQLREIVATSGAWNYVVHNAGLTKTRHTADFYKVNAQYTRNLLEALDKSVCMPEKFLLISSLCSYGPVAEKSSRPISLDDKQQPNSNYGKSKYEAETFVKTQNRFPYIIFHPTGVYGPGDKDYLMEIKSVRSGFDMKVGMKPQHLTFIYVKDLATAAFLALENEALCNRSYFVADGDVYTDTEFAGLIKNLLGKRCVASVRIPLWMSYLACACSELAGNMIGKAMTLNTDKYKILKQRNWNCETETLRRDLGFTPKYRLKEGLEETILYAKENGWLNVR